MALKRVHLIQNTNQEINWLLWFSKSIAGPPFIASRQIHGNKSRLFAFCCGAVIIQQANQMSAFSATKDIRPDATHGGNQSFKIIRPNTFDGLNPAGFFYDTKFRFNYPNFLLEQLPLFRVALEGGKEPSNNSADDYTNKRGEHLDIHKIEAEVRAKVEAEHMANFWGAMRFLLYFTIISFVVGIIVYRPI